MPQVYAEASSSITSSLTQIATEVTGAIGDIAPIAIGVFGVFIIWKLGMKFFKSVAKG
ncbi:MAG: hypothetical protein ACRC1F_03215 [Metamycoplasmataceae bacterium]